MIEDQEKVESASLTEPSIKDITSKEAAMVLVIRNRGMLGCFALES